jgi:hypothetical protein
LLVLRLTQKRVSFHELLDLIFGRIHLQSVIYNKDLRSLVVYL